MSDFRMCIITGTLVSTQLPQCPFRLPVFLLFSKGTPHNLSTEEVVLERFSRDGLEREIRKDQASLAAKCPINFIKSRLR